MSNNTPQPHTRPEWKALEAHQKSFSDTSIVDLFKDDAQRFETFHLSLGGLVFDYSKHRVNEETLSLLCDLAKACDVEGAREKMLAGETINASEGRAVLHTALRAGNDIDPALEINGVNIADFVSETLEKIKAIAAQIRDNPQITDVVNIGIGGSDLGPRMVCEALSSKADGPRVHFVSNIDGRDIEHVLAGLNPENTVFIIASKTFTTLETMTNATTAKKWAKAVIGDAGVEEHFFAVSMNVEACEAFGIKAENILPLRNWIGGRFSVWGAIGLPIAIANGFEAFEDFLRGAKAVDDRFASAPLEANIPVIMAMLGVWYNNFWGYHAHAVLPYAQDLRKFPSYAQQLDMESNGKSVDREGRRIPYATAPVTFGDCGTNGQHAFFQLLHQGTQIIPADFIAVIAPTSGLTKHHNPLLANALAQSQAMMAGQNNAEEPHRHFAGNRPSSTILLDRLDAYHMGMLLALYEHKVFVQGVIWNINSFDQWGVELGKKLAGPITKALDHGDVPEGADGSTAGLIDIISQKS